jgi:transmembrane sensor
MVGWSPFGLWPSAAEILADYRTSPGEQRKLVTVGGAQVTLNTETSLNVQSTAGHAERIDILSGEVAITTGGAVAHGVLVIAGDGQASAEQARFNVRLDRGGTCITCLDGEVRVERQAAVRMLHAGQQVVYGARGLEAPVPVDSAQVSAWQEGLLIFHYAPLTDVVAEVNRYRPGTVIVTNAALGRRLVNGRFRIDNVDSVLAMFQQIFGAKMTHLPGDIVLLS